MLKEQLRQALARVYRERRDILLRKDLSGEAAPASTRVELMAIGPQHREALVRFIREHHSNVERSLRMLEDCLRRGFAGRIARVEGQIIGYRWWVTSEMEHPQLALYDLSLRADEIYAFGLYIARAFRSHGYAGEFLALTQQQLLGLGVKKLYNAVGAANVPARKLYQRFGSQELELIVSRTFFSAAVYSKGRWLRYDPVWM